MLHVTERVRSATGTSWYWCLTSLNIKLKMIRDNVKDSVITHCALASAAVYRNLSCLFVCMFVCLWVCYHDNSKLRASIFTKLGLYVRVLTISSWLSFGRPAPPREGGLRRGDLFGSALLQPARSAWLRLSRRFFSLYYVINQSVNQCFCFRNKPITQR